MLPFVWGALTMGSLVAGAFMFKFWTRTRERLFALLGTAFVVFSINWVVLALLRPTRESDHLVYLIRLAAFVLIIVGIIDKNRPRRR